MATLARRALRLGPVRHPSGKCDLGREGADSPTSEAATLVFASEERTRLGTGVGSARESPVPGPGGCPSRGPATRLSRRPVASLVPWAAESGVV